MVHTQTIGLSQEQMTARSAGIGGSDVAAILGLNKWKTPLDVYREKVQGATVPVNDRMRFGLRLEDAIAAEYEEKTGRKVRRVNQTRSHPEFQFLLGNFDRTIVANEDGRGPGILEIKTTSGFSEKSWEDEIPLYYYCQVQHYMYVAGYSWAEIALLVDGYKFKIVPVERDDEFMGAALPILFDFWQNHVEAGVPPEPTKDDDLSIVFQREAPGTTLEAADDLYKTIAELKVLKAQISSLTSEAKEIEQQVKLAMGNYETLTFNGQPVATWKTQNRTAIDGKRLKADYPELYDDYTTTTDSRTFRIK